MTPVYASEDQAKALVEFGFVKTSLFSFDEWWVHPVTKQAMTLRDALRTIQTK